MASNKNITMRQFNGTDYDYLYPKTTTDQVSGLYDNIYTKSQSDGLYLKTNGSNAMTGNLNVGNHYLSNVANPVSPQDGVTKQYVDNQISNGLYSVNIAYNGNVRGTYSANAQIMGAASFNLQNALGISFTASLNCSFTGRYAGFQVMNQQVWVNYEIDRLPPAGVNIVIVAFIPFGGSFYNFFKPSGASSYVDAYSMQALTQIYRSGYVYSTGIFPRRQESPYGFQTPVNTGEFCVDSFPDSVTISSGYARTDVIYHR